MKFVPLTVIAENSTPRCDLGRQVRAGARGRALAGPWIWGRARALRKRAPCVYALLRVGRVLSWGGRSLPRDPSPPNVRWVDVRCASASPLSPPSPTAAAAADVRSCGRWSSSRTPTSSGTAASASAATASASSWSSATAAGGRRARPPPRGSHKGRREGGAAIE